MNVFRLFPYGLALGVVFLANCHLRMIRRRRFVEYHNIGVVALLQPTDNNDHAPLAKILANEIRRRAPRSHIEEVRLALIVLLVHDVAVAGDRKAAHGDVIVYLLDLRIAGKTTHDDYLIKHCALPPVS